MVQGVNCAIALSSQEKGRSAKRHVGMKRAVVAGVLATGSGSATMDMSGAGDDDTTGGLEEATPEKNQLAMLTNDIGDMGRSINLNQFQNLQMNNGTLNGMERGFNNMTQASRAVANVWGNTIKGTASLMLDSMEKIGKNVPGTTVMPSYGYGMAPSQGFMQVAPGGMGMAGMSMPGMAGMGGIPGGFATAGAAQPRYMIVPQGQQAAGTAAAAGPSFITTAPQVAPAQYFPQYIPAPQPMMSMAPAMNPYAGAAAYGNAAAYQNIAYANTKAVEDCRKQVDQMVNTSTKIAHQYLATADTATANQINHLKNQNRNMAQWAMYNFLSNNNKNNNTVVKASSEAKDENNNVVVQKTTNNNNNNNSNLMMMMMMNGGGLMGNGGGGGGLFGNSMMPYLMMNQNNGSGSNDFSNQLMMSMMMSGSGAFGGGSERPAGGYSLDGALLGA